MARRIDIQARLEWTISHTHANTIYGLVQRCPVIIFHHGIILVVDHLLLLRAFVALARVVWKVTRSNRVRPKAGSPRCYGTHYCIRKLKVI
jgi:hypothetical protein